MAGLRLRIGCPKSRRKLSPLDQAAVEVEKFHIRPKPLGQCEAISTREVVEEAASLESLLVDRRALPTVENCWKFVKIPTEKPCDAFWFVELCPETGLELGHFLDPDHIGTSGAVTNVTSYEVIGRAAPRARGRRVSFCHDVDLLP